MKSKKVGFLILNYFAYNETINCINSIIEKIDTKNYFIVVVDNGSKNESYEILTKKYEKSSKIKIINSKENLGFAKGNNIGFKYLKQHENCDYIVMLNSDVLLVSNDLLFQLESAYKKEKFAVLCPKIYDKNNNIYNFGTELSTIKKVKTDIFKCRILIILCKLHLIKLFFKLKKDNLVCNNKNYDNTMKDVVLHGCCLIFSEKYMDLFDGLDERTFLYREEELLYIRCKNNNLLSMYYPNIKIIHLEDVSTNMSIKNFTKRKLNTYINQLNSSKVLLSELKNQDRK